MEILLTSKMAQQLFLKKELYLSIWVCECGLLSPLPAMRWQVSVNYFTGEERNKKEENEAEEELRGSREQVDWLACITILPTKSIQISRSPASFLERKLSSGL